MRYCDYLHTCVLMIASAALALILVSAGSLAYYGSALMIVLSISWVVICIACGLWLGRGDFEPEHEEAEMELAWVPFAELRDAVVGGRLRDAHLALGVLLAESRLAPVPRRSGTDHDKEQDS